MLTFSQTDSVPKKIVLMLHGFGSSGEDMINFAHYIALPDILYVAPNAPYRNDFGYKWFDIGSVEKLNHALITKGVLDTRPHLEKKLDEITEKYALEHKDIILFGFSQGAMITLDMMMHHPSLIDGIAVAGAFHAASRKPVENKNILLIHGQEDLIVGHHFSVKAEQELSDLGATVTFESCPGVGHSINEQGILAMKAFLRNTMG